MSKMIFIFSHTKTMNKSPIRTYNKPLFKDKADIISNEIRKLSIRDIKKEFKLSDKLADTVYEYYNDFNNNDNFAILSYNGLSFKNLNAISFDEDDLAFAKDHVFILSALYGLLKIDDSISLYRLDFSNTNLYKYWNDIIYNYLKDYKVINLASLEYAKLITDYNHKDFIDVIFNTYENSNYRVIPTANKIMRGKYLNYIIKNKIDNLNSIKLICIDDYKFNIELSSNNKFVFTKFL